MKPISETAGRRIRRARKQAKFTQAQTAKRAGIAPARISEAEHGYASLTLRTLGRIAKALGVKPGDLLD